MGRRPARHRIGTGARAAPTAAQVKQRLQPRVVFSLEQANRALVFLRPVITDLREAVADALECHDRLSGAISEALRAVLVARQDRAIARLDRALDEIESVGADLVCCLSGAVAFPTVVESDPARLVWSPEMEGWSCPAPDAATRAPAPADDQ